MRKFWQIVSKRHIVFGLCLFAAAILISMLESAWKVKVQFGDTAVDIRTNQYTMNIPYDMVDEIRLIEMPEAGKALSGRDDPTWRIGHWENDTWGEYFICADLDADVCIEVLLDDSRIFVFSRRNNEETKKDFETFQRCLSGVY